MAKVWEWVTKWAWAIAVAFVGVFALGRKPSWIKEKEQEIKDRDKEIDAATEEAGDVAATYEEVKAKHDEAIEQAQTGEGRPGFTDPDSAASFIDDILGKRK